MGLYQIRSVFNNPTFNYVLEINFQLDSFTEYIKLTEEIVEKELKQKIHEYKEILDSNSDNEMLMIYSGDQYELKKNTYELYYNSILITMYSFLEKKLFQICKIAEENFTIKLSDLSGNGIFKYHKFLKKVVGIDFSEVQNEWAEITKYNKLRNRLVHDPSNEIELSNKNLNLINTIKSIQFLRVEENENHIVFSLDDKRTLLNFKIVIQNFLYNIYYSRAK